jgi:hypothetical protein
MFGSKHLLPNGQGALEMTASARKLAHHPQENA